MKLLKEALLRKFEKEVERQTTEPSSPDPIKRSNTYVLHQKALDEHFDEHHHANEGLHKDNFNRKLRGYLEECGQQTNSWHNFTKVRSKFTQAVKYLSINT